jgi:hypothetical protein
VRRLAVILLLCSCSEAKKQLRYGIGGSGASQQPGQPNVRAAGPSDIAGAVGAALGSAAVSRATGGCVAACPPGTACNEETGLCDQRPCRDLCKADEVCENDRCIPVLLPGLNIKTKSSDSR